MRSNKDGIVDKKFVHKHFPENVFVQNLRRSIPAFFDRATVENLIIPNTSITNRAIFLEYYLLHDPMNSSIHPDEFPIAEIRDQECYVLFNIPHSIASELLDDSEKKIHLNKKEKEIILKYYHKSSNSDHYVLKKSLTENEERIVQNILDRKDIHVSENERKLLADILEPIEALKRENIFYANMLINTKHEFFFEHPNEHVPGMMVLETARQFTLACWHIYGNVPVKGMQFILSQFNSNYYDYIDLHYPVCMRGELTKLEIGRDGEWRSIVFRTTFFQKGMICAALEIEGSVVSKRLFTRLRKGRDDTNPTHRFYPIDAVNCPIAILDLESERYINAKIWDISYGGFRLEIEDPTELNENKKAYGFMIFFPDIGFIRGDCELLWLKEESGLAFCGFQISKIEEMDTANLKEAIKRHCLVRSDRERV